MNTDNIPNHPRPETLDADAVCAQCNTVNAEGTLLCKVCGNNLRDQRMIRLAADQAMDLEHTGRRRKTWASGILFVLAIGLIVSTLVNQDQIVAWLIGAGGNQSGVNALWSGDYGSFLDEMLDDLSAKDITEETALAALESGAASGDAIDGTYVLFAEEDFVGTAAAMVNGDEIYFVAILENGDEVRGRAEAQGNYFASIPDAAALMDRGRMGAVRGVAMPQGNGFAECIGDYNNKQINFVAYRLPEG